MEEVREAIITEDKKIKCPLCGKTGGVVNEGAVVKNFRIRCRASRRNHEHYFILNFEGENEK